MTRRTFFARTLGALATTAIAPRLRDETPTWLGVDWGAGAPIVGDVRWHGAAAWDGAAVFHISDAGIFRNGELVSHDIRAHGYIPSTGPQ